MDFPEDLKLINLRKQLDNAYANGKPSSVTEPLEIQIAERVHMLRIISEEAHRQAEAERAWRAPRDFELEEDVEMQPASVATMPEARVQVQRDFRELVQSFGLLKRPLESPEAALSKFRIANVQPDAAEQIPDYLVEQIVRTTDRTMPLFRTPIHAADSRGAKAGTLREIVDTVKSGSMHYELSALTGPERYKLLMVAIIYNWGGIVDEVLAIEPLPTVTDISPVLYALKRRRYWLAHKIYRKIQALDDDRVMVDFVNRSELGTLLDEAVRLEDIELIHQTRQIYGPSVIHDAIKRSESNQRLMDRLFDQALQLSPENFSWVLALAIRFNRPAIVRSLLANYADTAVHIKADDFEVLSSPLVVAIQTLNFEIAKRIVVARIEFWQAEFGGKLDDAEYIIHWNEKSQLIDLIRNWEMTQKDLSEKAKDALDPHKSGWIDAILEFPEA